MSEDLLGYIGIPLGLAIIIGGPPVLFGLAKILFAIADRIEWEKWKNS